MRTRENFLVYIADQRARRGSDPQSPCSTDACRQAARATGGYDGMNRRGHDGLDPAPILVGGVLLENLRTSAVVQFWPNRNRLVPKWSSPPLPSLNMLSPLVAPNSFALVFNQAIRPADFNLRIR